MNKEYYSKNREKILEYGKKYRQDNKEKILEKNRKYYQNNKEKENQRYKEWYENNKEKKKEIEKKRKEKTKETLLKQEKEITRLNNIIDKQDRDITTLTKDKIKLKNIIEELEELCDKQGMYGEVAFKERFTTIIKRIKGR